MKNNLLFIFGLISSALKGTEPPKADENINWQLIYNISKRHSIANLIAYPAIDHNYDIPPEIKEKFKKKLYERILVSEVQNAETEQLFEAFEENDISYMPLKGVLLQNLYPSRDMRSMVDADILIKCQEYEKISQIMQELGYTYTSESDHECNYIKDPFVHIELHKHLIPSYNEDLYAYFGNGWKKAKKCENSNFRYEFGNEDNFIYIFSHFAKHYRGGGIGIGHVVDIWLLHKKYENMDKSYIENKFRTLNIHSFFENVMRLITAWFEGGAFDDTISDMTMYIVGSGTFGTLSNSMSATVIRENMSVDNAVRFKYIKFIFPKSEKMKKIFPVLQKFPFLLPVMWIWRVVRFVLFRRDKISKHRRSVESINRETVDKYSKHMNMVGLDIYNGRKTL